MYATLGLKGFYPVEEAYTLNQPHTNFPSHTDRTKTPGVDLTTGSLGQGMSTATGAALGNKLDGRDNHVFVFVGDGECDEGQVWEAAQFAAHYKLDNLICFVDDNKYQLDGAVDKVMSHGKGIGAKMDSFREMIGRVKAAYPQVSLFATTLREVVSANEHLWGAILLSGDTWYTAEQRPIPVLDRIGGGDGFVGGLLYGVIQGWSPEDCLHFGWATGVLATTSLMDYAQPLNEDQVWSIWAGNARVKR